MGFFYSRSHSSVSRVPAELVGRETFRSNFFKASPLRGGFDEIEDDEFADDPLFEDERVDLSLRPDFLSVGLSVDVRFSEACVILGGFLTGVPFGEIPPSFACSR